jgi:hypothetical protein
MFRKKPKKPENDITTPRDENDGNDDEHEHLEIDIDHRAAADEQEVDAEKPTSFFGYFTGKGLLGRKSTFNDWNREEMVMLLVSAGREVRSEQTAPLISLMDECDMIFRGKKAPRKPKVPDGLTKFRMNYCAAKIQNAWLKKTQRTKKKLMKTKSIGRLDSNDSSVGIEDMEWLRLREDFGSDSSSDEEVGMDLMQIEGIDAILAELNEALNEHWGESGTEPPEGQEHIGILSDAQKQETSKLIALLDQPFKMPSWDRARRSTDYLHPRKGGKGGARFQARSTYTGRHCSLGGCGEQCDLWQEGMVSEFGMFGSGITNYFKFVKWATWIFAILTIITLPELLTNIYSNDYYSKALLSLSRSTVGNLAPQTVGANITISLPFCQSNLFGDDCTLDRVRLGYFYAVVDAAVSVLLLIAFVWLRYYERIEEMNVDKNTIYASMYTVQVKNLPADCTEFKLTQHFNTILGGQFPIVSVHFGHPCEKEVEQCAARGKLIREKMRQIQLHRQKCQNAKFTIKDNELLQKTVQKYKIEALVGLKKIDIAISKFDTVLQELGKNIGEPNTAFITFEDNLAALICIDLFAEVLFDRWYFDQRLLMDGKRLEVKQAPEPSLIIWENLEHGSFDRFLRKCVTVAAALFLIAISLLLTLSDKLLGLKFGSFGGNEPCPYGFRELDRATQIEMIHADPLITHCYCQGLSSFRQSRDTECHDYFNELVRSQFLTLASSVMVLIISTLIEYAIRYFVEFEKHHSEDIKQRSIFLRLFLLQYLNSSIVFLVNIQNETILSWFAVKDQNKYNQYSVFSTSWYRSIGVSVLLVQLGNIFFNQQTSIYEYFAYHGNLKAVEKSSTMAVTQSELNEAHLGPEFELSFRYATIMSTMFICLTFSSGIPVMYMITGVCFYVYFVVDKYLFIKLYKSPHRFSTRIGKQATMLIPLGVAVHLFGAVWALADQEMFSYGADANAKEISNYTDHFILADIFSKISHKQTFPLFVLGAGIIIAYVLFYVCRYILRLVVQVRDLCIGNKATKDRIAELRNNHSQGSTIPFSKAVQRNVIKGLASYNLLQNPVYKHKFAITWNFAFRHQDVRSVMYMCSTQVGDEDDDVDRMYKLIRKEAKDKEFLANLSRTNEAGLIGSIKDSRDKSGKTSTVLSSRSASSKGENWTSGKGRPALQRMTSTMQRQALVLDDILAGDEAEMKEDQKKALAVSTELDDSPRGLGTRSSRGSETPDKDGMFTFPSDKFPGTGRRFSGEGSFENLQSSFSVGRPAAIHNTPLPANSYSARSEGNISARSDGGHSGIGKSKSKLSKKANNSKRRLPVNRAEVESVLDSDGSDTPSPRALANQAAAVVAARAAGKVSNDKSAVRIQNKTSSESVDMVPPPLQQMLASTSLKSSFHYSKPKPPSESGILPRTPATAQSVGNPGRPDVRPVVHDGEATHTSSGDSVNKRGGSVYPASRHSAAPSFRTPFDDVNIASSRSTSSAEHVRPPELFVSASAAVPPLQASSVHGYGFVQPNTGINPTSNHSFVSIPATGSGAYTGRGNFGGVSHPALNHSSHQASYGAPPPHNIAGVSRPQLYQEQRMSRQRGQENKFFY